MIAPASFVVNNCSIAFERKSERTEVTQGGHVLIRN